MMPVLIVSVFIGLLLPVALAMADVCHAAASNKRDARSPVIESQIEILSNSARRI
jgi:hypothetical protein